MARYLLTDAAYIGDRYFESGAVLVLPDAFVPGPHMEPALDDKGVPDSAAVAAKAAAGEQKMPRPGDPSYIGDLIEHTLRDGSTNGRIEASSRSATAAGPPGDPDPLHAKVLRLVESRDALQEQVAAAQASRITADAELADLKARLADAESARDAALTQVAGLETARDAAASSDECSPVPETNAAEEGAGRRRRG